MPEPLISTISMREMLVERVKGVVGTLSRARAGLVEFVVELGGALARYREEGVALYPQVFVCSDIGLAVRMMGGRDITRIGTGPATEATALKGLKECAPLAQGSWAVYFLDDHQQGRVEYGLFRFSGGPLAINPTETLVNSETELLMLTSIAENVVEVLCSSGAGLRIHFTNAATSTVRQPASEIDRFVRSIVGQVAEDAREPAKNYFTSTIGRILQSGRGTLAAVIRAGDSLPGAFSDGIILAPPVDLLERIQQYRGDASPEAAFGIQGATTLLKGMMTSDGITVLDTDGRIRAYRVFVQLQDAKTAGSLPSGRGGRGRAFKVLCSAVRSGLCRAALYRSHDGITECEVADV